MVGKKARLPAAGRGEKGSARQRRRRQVRQMRVYRGRRRSGVAVAGG